MKDHLCRAPAISILDRLTGSARTIGRQHGEMFSTLIRSELSRIDLRSRRRAVRIAFRTWEKLISERTPLLAEEIAGLADGARLDFEEAVLIGLVGISDRELAPEGCTSLYAGAGATDGKSILIGQNKDTHTPSSRYRILSLMYDEGLGAVTLTYPGLLCGLAVNHHGVFATANARFCREPAPLGIPLNFVRRLALESSSVEAVLADIEGLSFSDGASIIADRNGRAVLIEAVGGHVAIHDVSGRSLATSNTCMEPAFHDRDISGMESPSSAWRQHQGTRLLEQTSGSLTLAMFQKILSDHENFPLSICRHECHAEKQTTSACIVADLSENEVRIALGRPCETEFHTLKVPSPRKPAMARQEAV